LELAELGEIHPPLLPAQPALCRAPAAH
jgi:hypothetical protein